MINKGLVLNYRKNIILAAYSKVNFKKLRSSLYYFESINRAHRMMYFLNKFDDQRRFIDKLFESSLCHLLDIEYEFRTNKFTNS